MPQSEPSVTFGPMLASAKVTAIANQKGGVGKTTLAVNLGAALAAAGRRILLIDLDPQANASTSLGMTRQPGPTTYDVLVGSAGLSESLRPTRWPLLDLAPAAPDLAGAEIDLVSMPEREHRLRRALDRLRSERATHDLVLLDCPPSLGLITVNALVAARGVLVPLQCEFLALEGVVQLLRTVDLVRAGPNANLKLIGVVLTMFDRRNNLSDLVAADARGFFGPAMFETVIPRTVRLSEAPSHGQPILAYDPRSVGALAFSQLAAEFVRRLPDPANG